MSIAQPVTLFKKENPAEMFFYEFCEISTNTYFAENLRTAGFYELFYLAYYTVSVKFRGFTENFSNLQPTWQYWQFG